MIENMQHANKQSRFERDSFPSNHSSNSFARKLGCHEDTLGPSYS